MWTATFENGNKIIARFTVWGMIKPFVEDLVLIEYTKVKKMAVNYKTGEMSVNDQIVATFDPGEIDEMVPACFHNVRHTFESDLRNETIGITPLSKAEINYAGLGFKGKIDGKDVRKIIRLYPNGRYMLDESD